MLHKVKLLHYITLVLLLYYCSYYVTIHVELLCRDMSDQIVQVSLCLCRTNNLPKGATLHKNIGF